MCRKQHGGACNNPNRDILRWVNIRDETTGQSSIDMCSGDAKSLDSIRRSFVEQYFDEPVTSVDSTDGSMPLKLIDTFERRTIFPDKPVAYAALSYVWGNVQRVYMNKDDFSSENNQPPSAPLPLHLPKTFEDALILTKSLRLRYLWIDALCISQDDDVEKQREINRMDTIYSQAFITFIAVDGPDVNYGLPRVTEDLPYSAQVCETIDGRTYATKLPATMAIRKWWPWDRRAWTFQEAVFSRRCLYITYQEIFLECCSWSYRESMELPPTEDPKYPHKSRIIPFIDLPSLQKEKPFGLYDLFVSDIARRDITYPGDMLNTFRGMQKQLSAVMETYFVGGLPVALLPPALLWTDPWATKRIDEFASWSWAGWKRTAVRNPYLGLWKRQVRKECTDMFKLLEVNDKLLSIETWTAEFRFEYQEVEPHFTPDNDWAFLPLNPETNMAIFQMKDFLGMNMTQAELKSSHNCRFTCIFIASYKNIDDAELFRMNGYAYAPEVPGVVWVWCLVLKVEQDIASRIGVTMMTEEDWKAANPQWKKWTLS